MLFLQKILLGRCGKKFFLTSFEKSRFWAVFQVRVMGIMFWSLKTLWRPFWQVVEGYFWFCCFSGRRVKGETGSRMRSAAGAVFCPCEHRTGEDFGEANP